MTRGWSLDLGGTWSLTSPVRDGTVDIALPGDVHSALLAAGQIPDPYFRANEAEVAWVHRTPWTVDRTVEVPAEMAEGRLTLTLSEVDCIATVSLNDEVVARLDNQFVRHDIVVTGKIRAGANRLRIDFAVVADVAKARAGAHPFPIPWSTGNQKVAHLNFVRKTACHAGWDWGICLMPTGVYGRMELRRSARARIDAVQVEQAHEDGRTVLTIRTHLHAFEAGDVDLTHRIDGQTVSGIERVAAGPCVIERQVAIDAPLLWWPAGQGDQPLYGLTTTMDGEEVTQRIGLRRLDWVVEPDAIDHCFKCRVNGRDVTMMGANWIPADALPSRITREAVTDLLDSAVAANMNMIRVWGGGQYEPDWFYDLCDERGLLVWQDFMFSCMPYPSDRAFLAGVRPEITQQVRRLSHHACIALWCGDNEVIGSLTWYSETRADPERHIANYDRLNSMLGEIVADEDPSRRFWPSSPSLGYLDFSDGWHTDTRGDMHFWDVWHSARPFEHYRTVQPRFASEFGFQSFPSMDVIERFTEPGDRNPSSPVMEVHQRNEGGNARILETMCRYFRFPKGFEEMVFLSQVQQALAIRTAIEFWRSTKPRCMGTLYWQLNDTWPVASWSSLDHGGGWKPLHHLIRRVYAPVTVMAIPVGDEIVVKGVNDSPAPMLIRLEILRCDMAGGSEVMATREAGIGCAAAEELARLPAGAIGEGQFLLLRWSDAKGTQLGQEHVVPRAYKYYDLPDAQVTATRDGGDLVLGTDAPAFFVTVAVEGGGRPSDNCLTLMPDRPVRLSVAGASEGAAVTLRHLAQTY